MVFMTSVLYAETKYDGYTDKMQMAKFDIGESLKLSFARFSCR